VFNTCLIGENVDINMWSAKAKRHDHMLAWEKELADGVGDADASTLLGSLAEDAFAAGEKAPKKKTLQKGAKGKADFGDILWELREHVHELRALHKAH
jgi:hypothetical protein